jgi:hypothetical protein
MLKLEVEMLGEQCLTHKDEYEPFLRGAKIM